MHFPYVFLGQLAGIISLISYCIYIRSVLKGDTRPSRSTWWILTLVGGLIFWSSYMLGAHEAFWIQLCYVIGPLLIAICSLKYGEGEGFSMLDKICLIGAVASAVLWVVFNSPLIGLLGSIIVDFIGLIPTMIKSFLRPENENFKAWLLETIASILNALAVTSWLTLEHKDWIYGLYLLIINCSITMLLWRKRIVAKFKK